MSLTISLHRVARNIIRLRERSHRLRWLGTRGVRYVGVGKRVTKA